MFLFLKIVTTASPVNTVKNTFLVLLERNLTQLMTNVIFSGQRFVIIAMFFGGEVA